MRNAWTVAFLLAWTGCATTESGHRGPSKPGVEVCPKTAALPSLADWRAFNEAALAAGRLQKLEERVARCEALLAEHPVWQPSVQFLQGSSKATWCSPCLRELPALQKFWKAHRDQGVERLTVSIDDYDEAGKIEPLLENNGWDFPVLLKNPEQLKGYNYHAVPALVVPDDRVIIGQTTAGDRTRRFLFHKACTGRWSYQAPIWIDRDLDGDGQADVIIASYDGVAAYRADGTPLLRITS